METEQLTSETVDGESFRIYRIKNTTYSGKTTSRRYMAVNDDVVVLGPDISLYQPEGMQTKKDFIRSVRFLGRQVDGLEDGYYRMMIPRSGQVSYQHHESVEGKAEDLLEKVGER